MWVTNDCFFWLQYPAGQQPQYGQQYSQAPYASSAPDWQPQQV